MKTNRTLTSITKSERDFSGDEQKETRSSLLTLDFCRPSVVVCCFFASQCKQKEKRKIIVQVDPDVFGFCRVRRLFAVSIDFPDTSFAGGTRSKICCGEKRSVEHLPWLTRIIVGRNQRLNFVRLSLPSLERTGVRFLRLHPRV